MTITEAYIDAEKNGIARSEVDRFAALGYFEPVSERSDVESDIDALECDLESWESDLEELTQNIAKAKAKLARLRKRLAELPPDEDD